MESGREEESLREGGRQAGMERMGNEKVKLREVRRLKESFTA